LIFIPFEETVNSGAGQEDIIEKIDIGGISLIRAAAKNFKDVVIVASKNDYTELEEILKGTGMVQLLLISAAVSPKRHLTYHQTTIPTFSNTLTKANRCLFLNKASKPARFYVTAKTRIKKVLFMVTLMPCLTN
jgi:AICAR transformylase/IMP cyclohydrolase PurH